ncbi:MAG TPA: ATPase, partial [Desulfobacteraceae bacterium]|nr:ATPase [Desulfobacteraceae bacterium]
METHNEKLPDPREIERELAEFLSKKFGGEVRVISPFSFPQELREETPPEEPVKEEKKTITFDL